MASRTKTCHTCLSSDRVLSSLAKFRSLLLELNLKVNHEGGICWECQRHMEKFSRFRTQVQRAQNIINSENLLTTPSLTTLSLSKSYYHYSHQDKITKSNITCTEAGPIVIKKEIDNNVNWNDGTVVDVDAYDDEIDTGECTDLVVSNSVLENDVGEQNTTDIGVLDQNHIDSETQVFSELPRITLVKSITDDRNEPTEPCQVYTEIIELNIPVHVPTHEDESDNFHHIEGSPAETLYQLVNQETNKTKSNGNIAASTIDKATDVNLNLNGNDVEHYADSQDEMDIIKAIDSCLAATDPTYSLASTTDHTYCCTPLRTHDEVSTASGGVLNKTQAKKDIITVKVAYKGILGGTTVKCEPISDDEHNYDDCYVHNGESSLGQSRNAGPEELDQSLWRKSILLLYTNLRNHTAARIFWYPVTDAIAPRYSEAVKRPMDFRTIGTNIKNGVIATTEQFHRDILLMLTNALMYNSSDHCVYHMAKQVVAEAKSQLDMLMSIHTPSQASNQETPNQRPRRRLKSLFHDEGYWQTAKKARTSSPVKPKPEPRDCKPKISPNVQKHDTVDSNSKIRKISIEKDIVIGDIWEFDRYNRPMRKDRKRKSKLTVKVKAEKMEEAAKKNQYGASKVITPVKFNEPKVNRPVGFKETKKGASKITTVNFSETKRRGLQPKGKTAVKIKTEMIQKAKKTKSKPKDVTTVNFKRDKDVSHTVVRRSGRKRNELNYSIAIHGENKSPKLNPKLAKVPTVKIEPLDVKIKPKLEKIYSKPKGLDNDDEREEPTDFHVAITSETLRDLNRDEGTLIKKILQESILNLALESNFTPRFKGEPIIAEGVVKLWCSDRRSLNWLQITVENFPKILGRLTVKKLSELPKKIKSAVSIPGYYGELEVIKRLLNAQNPWAQVSSWSFTSVEQRGESLFIVLGIPPFIIPKLLSRQRQLAYILGSVHIEFFNRQGNLVNTPPGYVK